MNDMIYFKGDIIYDCYDVTWLDRFLMIELLKEEVKAKEVEEVDWMKEGF